jgi:hypothetical protein
MSDSALPRKSTRPLVETLKISKAERIEIKQAARRLKVPRSQFIRDAALAACRALKAA